ncbi:MAG: U32 family peptidase [Desulfovibrio sp.]|jgi:putative protease|nr:U32 family peptidase [Desulfovibrio sp.]
MPDPAPQSVPPAPTPSRPEILAPAGDVASCIAALAAGADAVYVGMKHFSARMEATNFSLPELARLATLAHEKGRRLYVAFNSLVKPSEVGAAWRLLVRLQRQVHPDAIILQDIGMLDLAAQAGFKGGLFLSTLANATHPEALSQACAMGATRVILPRELSFAEIRAMGAICPDGLDLECFVHGALCLCVSGRCYWSSYLGGKSGLRGRCVQPCRREYAASAGQASGRQGKKAQTSGTRGHVCLSCLDLSLDAAVRDLMTVPHLVSWKIEGRRKGPHYVSSVVSAYRLLRDETPDRQLARDVSQLLSTALGRATTTARFIGGKPILPTGTALQTSSGHPVGQVEIKDRMPILLPRIPLQAGDLLRIGTEGRAGHTTVPVKTPVGKGEVFPLDPKRHGRVAPGTPVYLVDRRDRQAARLADPWRKRYEAIAPKATEPVQGDVRMPRPAPRAPRKDLVLLPGIPQGQETKGSPKTFSCLWVSPKCLTLSRTVQARFGWWLPPVIWPAEEAELLRHIRTLLHNGARHFVCNAPWQRGLFPGDATDLDLLAGPFCNTANAMALEVLAGLGFAGAFASPELDRESLLALLRQSPLPLGLVLSGHWPVGLSRFAATGAGRDRVFVSPMGERFWMRQYGGTAWIYPAWPLDMTEHREELERAGYSFFAHMQERPPQGLNQAPRKSCFNWDGQLL